MCCASSSPFVQSEPECTHEISHDHSKRVRRSLCKNILDTRLVLREILLLVPFIVEK